MLEYVFSRAFLSEHWGDICSAAALVITIGGFALTLVRIRRTRMIAEETRQRLEQNLRIADVSEAIAVAKEIKRLQRERAEWKVVLDRYAHLSSILQEIETGSRNLSAKGLKSLRAAIKLNQSLERDIENEISRGATDLDVGRLNGIVSSLLDKFSRVAAEIKSGE